MDLVSPVQKTTAVRDISSNKSQNKPGDSAPVETKAVVRSSPVSSVGTQSFVVSNGLYTATISNKNGGSFSKFVFEKYSKHDSSNVNIIDHYNSNNLLRIYTELSHYNPKQRIYLADILRPFLPNNRFNEFGIDDDIIKLVENIEDSDICLLPMAWNYYLNNNKQYDR